MYSERMKFGGGEPSMKGVVIAASLLDCVVSFVMANPSLQEPLQYGPSCDSEKIGGE